MQLISHISVQIQLRIFLKIYIYLSFAFLPYLSHSQSLNLLWTVSEGIKTPESVLYIPKLNVILVSNMNGGSTTKDGNGFISQVDIDGKMKNISWITGLDAPKGMAVYKNRLFVTDIDKIIEIDITKSIVLHKYKVEDARLLNDVAVDKHGRIFVSDMNGSKIYTFKNGKVKVWLAGDQLNWVNGLLIDGQKLFAGNGKLLQIDLKTKKIENIIDETGGIDGLKKLYNGVFLYSNYNGRIFMFKYGRKIKMTDTVGQKCSADLDYIPQKGWVIVPTLSSNSVEAYQLFE